MADCGGLSVAYAISAYALTVLHCNVCPSKSGMNGPSKDPIESVSHVYSPAFLGGHNNGIQELLSEHAEYHIPSRPPPRNLVHFTTALTSDGIDIPSLVTISSRSATNPHGRHQGPRSGRKHDIPDLIGQETCTISAWQWAITLQWLALSTRGYVL